MNLNAIPRWLLYGLIVLLIVLLAICIFKCCSGTEVIGDSKGQIPPHNQVNVQLAANIPDDKIKDRIIAATPPPDILNANDIVLRRCKCDSTLLNITLPSSYTIKGVDGELHVQSTPKGATGGVDLPLTGVIGSNFVLSPFDTDRIDIGRDSILENTGRRVTPFVEPAGGTLKTVSIAIFDSGLDPSYMPSTSWQLSTNQCDNSSMSLNGWNFVADGTSEFETKDGTSMHHGSRVAKLIVRQFNASAVVAKIVPMRVLDNNNTGDLFSILCAMETARKNNIEIFNMSFGYYGHEDTLFREYVKRATDSGVRLVTAAGNRTAEKPTDRNFTTMDPKFYPAYFARTNDWVFVATTAHLDGNNLFGCDYQNYGPGQVLGVLEDVNSRFYMIPPVGKPALIFGSSYAAPVLAGWLARKLKENPGQILGWRTLPSVPLFLPAASRLIKRAPKGNQLYKNAYLQSASL